MTSINKSSVLYDFFSLFYFELTNLLKTYDLMSMIVISGNFGSQKMLDSQNSLNKKTSFQVKNIKSPGFEKDREKNFEIFQR